MSDSPIKPTNNSAGQTPSPSEINFRTEDIGRWKSQQENPFAEQNRREANKKAERKAKFKKVRPVLIIAGIIVGAILIIGIIIAIVIAIINNTPKAPIAIKGGSMDDISSYQQNLQEIYNQALSDSDSSDDSSQSQANALQAVSEAVDKTLGTESGEEYRDQVLFAQVLLLFRNYQNEATIEVALQINPESLSLEQQAMYYGVVYNCYALLDDYGAAEPYLQKSIELSMQIGNGYEGGLVSEQDAL